MINVATKKSMSRHNEDQMIELCRDTRFLCRDIVKEVSEEDIILLCHDIDQSKWQPIFVKTFKTLSRHKELKREESISRHNKTMSRHKMVDQSNETKQVGRDKYFRE